MRAENIYFLDIKDRVLIDFALKDKHLTYKDLREKLDLSIPTFNLLIKGNRHLKHNELEILEKVLDIKFVARDSCSEYEDLNERLYGD